MTAYDMGKRAVASSLTKWLQAQNDELIFGAETQFEIINKLSEITPDWSPPCRDLD